MKRPSDADTMESSGLLLGSEPLKNVRYRSAAHDDDKTDKVGDTGDDDSVDTDQSDTDGTDGDTRDSDGKD